MLFSEHVDCRKYLHKSLICICLSSLNFWHGIINLSKRCKHLSFAKANPEVVFPVTLHDHNYFPYPKPWKCVFIFLFTIFPLMSSVY